MSDWKSNYEHNMQLATGNSSHAVNNECPSLEGDKEVSTIHGVLSVLRLNELLSQLPEDHKKIDEYLTKAEQAQKEARKLKNLLDFIEKI